MIHDHKSLDVTNGRVAKRLTTATTNKDKPLSPQISDSDIFFAKERLSLHKATPEEGVSLQVLKNYIYKKYGI